jgi:hypothetical protein
MEDHANAEGINMTQDEIIDMAIEAEFVSHGKPSDEESELFVCVDKDIYKFAKLVAAKAIAELESQEPWCMKMNGCTAKCEDCPDEPPLTPQRTWVGLASEDRLTAKYMQDAPSGIEAVIDYIEAKLKQKNGFAEEKNT